MISIEETKKIADLAKLKFTEPELEKMSEELSNILGYMEVLENIDTSKVVENEIISTNVNIMRKDEQIKFKNQKEILENTTTIDGQVNIPAMKN